MSRFYFAAAKIWGLYGFYIWDRTDKLVKPFAMVADKEKAQVVVEALNKAYADVN